MLSPDAGADFNYTFLTQKERDIETGLDFFEARYYASTQGRFTSADPFDINMQRQNASDRRQSEESVREYIGDPGHWNRYAYVLNNPMTHNDPTGLDVMIIENGPTKDNPIGHTAIAITGRGVYSMGNGVPGGAHVDSKNNIVGGSVKDYIIDQSSRRNTTIVIIKTTAEQDTAAAKSMEDQAASKPMLTREGIVSDNCTVRANEAMDAAGVAHPKDPVPQFVPGSAGVRGFEAGNNPVVMNVPQNSNLTEADRQAIKPFEAPRTIPAPGTPGGTPVVTMPAQTRKKPEDE